MIQDVTGKELDFGSEIETPEQIVVGVKATVAGTAAEGDYTMESGQVYKFVAGELKEIVEPEAAATIDPEKEQLKADLAEAQKQLAAVQNKLTIAAEETNKFKAEFDKFKNQFSTGDPKPAAPGSDPEPGQSRKAFKK
jgi:hypothetical protein